MVSDIAIYDKVLEGSLDLSVTQFEDVDGVLIAIDWFDDWPGDIKFRELDRALLSFRRNLIVFLSRVCQYRECHVDLIVLTKR